MPPRKPTPKKTNKPNPKKTNNQRLSEEEIHKRVKEALKQGLRTNSDFKQQGLLGLYQLVLRRIKDGTFKVKTFNEYLRKYHSEFNIPKHQKHARAISENEIHKRVKEALKLGLRTCSDFQRHGLLSIYQLVLSRIQNGTFKVKTFNEYLRKYHSEFNIPEEKPVKRITSSTDMKNNLPFSKNQILNMIYFMKENKYLTPLFKKSEKKPRNSLNRRLSLLSDEEFDNIVANLLKTNRLTTADMQHSKYSSTVYSFLQNQIRNGKKFRGYGGWPNYIQKVHKRSLLSDKRFRARQPLTEKEKEFIRNNWKEAERIIGAHIQKRKIFLQREVFKDLIQDSLETAARNYNPKKAKFSTYITHTFDGHYKGNLAKLNKKRTISIDQSKSNSEFRLKSVLAAKPKTEVPETFSPIMQKFEKLFKEGKLTDLEAIVLLARASGNTLKEIGNNLGKVSHQRIEQIEKKAKQKLEYLT